MNKRREVAMDLTLLRFNIVKKYETKAEELENDLSVHFRFDISAVFVIIFFLVYKHNHTFFEHIYVNCSRTNDGLYF